MDASENVFCVVCNVGNEYISCDVRPVPLWAAIPNCLCLSLHFFFIFLNELIPVLTSVGLHRKTSQNTVINKDIRTLKPVEMLFFGIQLPVNEQTHRRAGRGDEGPSVLCIRSGRSADVTASSR